MPWLIEEREFDKCLQQGAPVHVKFEQDGDDSRQILARLKELLPSWDVTLAPKKKSTPPQQRPDRRPSTAIRFDAINGRRLLLHPTPPLVALRPGNPLRPPEWRWHLAKLLRGDRRKALWAWVDEDVRRAKSLMPKIRACREPEQLQQLLESGTEAADQLRAFVIWRMDDATRNELEARLLAKENYEEIAEVLDVSAGCVDWYRRWFFDCKDVGPAVADTQFHLQEESLVCEANIPHLLKLCARRGGPSLLDVLIRGDTDPVKRVEAEAFFNQLSGERVRINGLFSLMAADVTDPRTAKKVLGMHGRLRRLEQLQRERAVDIRPDRDAFVAGIDRIFGRGG